MPRFLGMAMALTAVLLAGFSGPEAAAATGVGGPVEGKPLGTLWYPGPYDPGQAPTPAPAPVAAPTPIPPAAQPLGPPAMAPAPPPPAPVGAPEPGKPLGTLWYPGPRGAAPAARPAAQPTTPAAAMPAPTPVAPPAVALPAISDEKPLGTLWYPGPYDAARPAVVAPVPGSTPAPAAAPTAASQPAGRPPRAAAQAAPPPSAAPAGKSGKLDSTLPVKLSADEMSFDQEQGVVTASGNVVVVHGDRRLRADVIVYNQKTDVVSASGNIELIEPGGERIFADVMDITGDFRDAVVQSIGILMTDRSRIAAVAARRSDANITEFRKGVYSPCNLCKTDPSKPPLWQVKAVKIIHDKEGQVIEYRDAWLEVFGIPVAYTPYLSHPDPTVKRRSGLLAPSWGNSSDLGYVFRVPYFFNISPQQDATLTALATTDAGSGGIIDYRGRYRKGKLDLTGSLVSGDSDSDEPFRGHIDAKGRFDIDDTWRWGFDAYRASDDTYLRRYSFSSPAVLDSRLFAEGFRRRNYFAFNTYAFQDLRGSGESGLEPYVLPMFDYNHVGETDRFGGQTLLDVNMLAITRTDGGADTRRLSIRPGWQRPFIGPLGDAYKLSFALNTDLYHVDDLDRTGRDRFSGFSGRVAPQAMLDWRYPLVRNGETFSQIIEPIVVAVYSPNGGNSLNIPNEDSTELEFDDTNLFSASKFSGIDRVEGGPRINYGVKWGVYGRGKNSGSTSVFIGQAFRPRADDTFASGSGLENKFSDFVGRVRISPASYLNLLYRTRFDGDNLSPKRNEVAVSAGIPALSVGTNYIFIQPQQGSEFPGREELSYSVSSQLTRRWRFSFSGLNDLEQSETRSINATLVFENECLKFTTRAARTFFEDRDLRPNDQITFNIVLKTLGEVHTGLSPGL